jgi:myo-inositol-1(or 4)-monophosphatase
MNGCEHVVIADNQGCFYCRAVDAYLNCRKDEHVCGKGCPFFVNAEVRAEESESGAGRFVCRYDESDSLFPTVQGLDDRLWEAYEYSATAHRGQCRKGTKIPYFSHIITTMNYEVELTEDIEILQAAILHDTIEDTDVTFEKLKEKFGERVASLVKAETENKRFDMPANESWEIRKSEGIERVKGGNMDVKLIVLADKTANLESLVREWRHVGDDVWRKFNQTDKKKQEWYFKSIREHLMELRDTGVMKKFDEYVNILFG